ncbi:MAG TPA: hypothetical protein VFS02_16215, partial [Telluria sp.]|nr:hypothetical protein [Telluria sp.]
MTFYQNSIDKHYQSEIFLEPCEGSPALGYPPPPFDRYRLLVTTADRGNIATDDNSRRDRGTKQCVPCAKEIFFGVMLPSFFVAYCCDIVKISVSSRFPRIRFFCWRGPRKSIFQPGPMSQLDGKRFQNRHFPDVQSPTAFIADLDAAR